MIDVNYSVAAFLIVSLVTGFSRAIPYLMFGGKKQLPPAVHYLGTVLPASIMIILVVYCLRNIELSKFPFGLAELISAAVVVVAQVIKKNTFISILLGTACYMILIRTLFPT